MKLSARLPNSVLRAMLLLPLAVLPVGCAAWHTGTITPQELPADMQASAANQPPRLRLDMLGGLSRGPYHVVSGDLLDVTIPDLYEENRAVTVPLRVAGDGTVRLPLAGTVRVASLTLPDCEQTISQAFATEAVLRRADVVVALHPTGKVRVNVVGAVVHPGQYELTPGDSDLLGALLAAGGVTPEAGARIEIRHPAPEPDYARPRARVTGLLTSRSSDSPATPAAAARASTAAWTVPEGPQSVSFLLTSNSDRRTLSQGVLLQRGDTVYVEERKPAPIYVVGLVNKPGEYHFPVEGDLRLLEAIGLAGGVDRTSLPTKVVVVRKKPDKSGMVAIRVDLNEAKRDLDQNICLMPGDTVSVEENVQSYMRGLLRGALRIGVGADLNTVPMLP